MTFTEKTKYKPPHLSSLCATRVAFEQRGDERCWGKSGITLIEIVIGVGIISIILVSLVSSLQFFLKRGLIHTEQIQSSFLLEEGIEVMRFFRDDSWSNISDLVIDTEYYLFFEGSSWDTTTTATTTNSFTRTVTLRSVYRKDSDDRIVASSSPEAKTLDPNTVLITVKVTSQTSNVEELSTYITNLLNN